MGSEQKTRFMGRRIDSSDFCQAAFAVPLLDFSLLFDLEKSTLENSGVRHFGSEPGFIAGRDSESTDFCELHCRDDIVLGPHDMANSHIRNGSADDVSAERSLDQIFAIDFGNSRRGMVVVSMARRI